MLSSLNERPSQDKILLGVLLTFNVSSGLSAVYEDVAARINRSNAGARQPHAAAGGSLAGPAPREENKRASDKRVYWGGQRAARVCNVPEEAA